MAATSTQNPPAAIPLGAGDSAAVAHGGTRAARLRAWLGRARVHAGERPRWWAELLVVAWLAWLYDAVTNLAPAREALAIAHGRSILSFEQSLGIDPEATLNRWLSHHQTLGAIASYYYDNAHFVVTLGLLSWLWWKRADIYRPLRNTLVVVNLLGLLVFWLCPVAPPRMLSASGFSDVVAASHTFGSWHTGSLAADADQFGAMPSLHLAWAAWCTLAIWSMTACWPRRGGRWAGARKWARALALAYPVLTTFAVLATGNHYLLDVLAGVATCAVAAGVVRLASGGPGWRPRPVSA